MTFINIWHEIICNKTKRKNRKKKEKKCLHFHGIFLLGGKKIKSEGEEVR